LRKISKIKKKWVLVEVPSSQCCLVRSSVADREFLLMRGCQLIIRKAWPRTIVGNVFGECHAPYILKTSFVDFGKEYADCSCLKTKLFVPIHISIPLQWESKVVHPVALSLPSFLFSFYILFSLFSYWINL